MDQSQRFCRLIILCLYLIPYSQVHGALTGGIGYIRPEPYRVDNLISPLPFGLSLFPVIAYRGERLSIFGPNIQYFLSKGMISFGPRLRAAGDRYQSRSIAKRETAINAGAFLRLLFLSFSYDRDISNRYQGDMTTIGIGHRFKFLDRFIFAPSLTREFLSQEFVTYYYGVPSNESGRFLEYSPTRAQNTILRASLTLILNSQNSITSNYNYKTFDKVIFNSPTVNQRSFGTFSLFWNYKI